MLLAIYTGAALLCGLYYLLRIVPYTSVSISPVWVLDPASVLLIGAPPALWAGCRFRS